MVHTRYYCFSVDLLLYHYLPPLLTAEQSRQREETRTIVLHFLFRNKLHCISDVAANLLLQDSLSTTAVVVWTQQSPRLGLLQPTGGPVHLSRARAAVGCTTSGLTANKYLQSSCCAHQSSTHSSPRTQSGIGLYTDFRLISPTLSRMCLPAAPGPTACCRPPTTLPPRLVCLSAFQSSCLCFSSSCAPSYPARLEECGVRHEGLRGCGGKMVNQVARALTATGALILAVAVRRCPHYSRTALVTVRSPKRKKLHTQFSALRMFSTRPHLVWVSVLFVAPRALRTAVICCTPCELSNVFACAS